MAQSPQQIIGQKRGPGRPPKAATIALKRQKLEAEAAATASAKDPTPQVDSPVNSPAPEKAAPALPSRASDYRPLPTLPEPQGIGLSDTDYQSLAASAVLASSFVRSRHAWTSTGIFERYWVKPETGKHARPPPPNNPEVKSMKGRGRCRLRIEPHIFEVELYVVEKPRPPPPPKQYIAPVQPSHGGFGQPFRQGQPQVSPIAQQPYQNQQNQALPPTNPQAPLNGAQTVGSALSTATASQTAPPPPPPPPPPATTQQTSPAPAQDKKPSPDPVISMLATRASSDPELKALMKEVATGKATQEQLKVFQKHIDELTAVIRQRKAKEEEAEKKRAEQARIQALPPPVQRPFQHTPQPAVPAYQPPRPQQQTWVPPPPPPPGEVVFSFTNTGASEDRFLFPQHSILEPLSAQHVLASFIVTREGRDAVDNAGLDPEAEYWQPITLMVEVAYGREGILKDVTRWVKPAEEVREHMKGVMARCKKAPDTYLALRLPFKGSVVEDKEDSVKPGTPVPFLGEQKKSRMKHFNRPGPKTKGDPNVKNGEKENEQTKSNEDGPKETVSGQSGGEAAGTSTSLATAPGDTATAENADGNAVKQDRDGPAETAAPDTESGRPKRSTRKSVRISTG